MSRTLKDKNPIYRRDDELMYQTRGKLHESGATQLQKWEPPDCINGSHFRNNM